MINQQTIDLSLLPQMDPNEAKFERRIKLVQSTMSQLTKPQTEELINVLLDQVNIQPCNYRNGILSLLLYFLIQVITNRFFRLDNSLIYSGILEIICYVENDTL